jgi:hypothetical protein
VKKSKASQDQPKNATCVVQLLVDLFVQPYGEDRHTKKFNHCCLLRRVRALKGFGAGFIGGTSEVKRVAIYWPTLMFSSTSGDVVTCWCLPSVSMTATGW